MNRQLKLIFAYAPWKGFALWGVATIAGLFYGTGDVAGIALMTGFFTVWMWSRKNKNAVKAQSKEGILNMSKKEMAEEIELERLNREMMCSMFKKDNEFAFEFAKKFGEKKFVASFITSPKWAFWWCKEFGENEKMEQVIIESEDSSRWSYLYAVHFDEPVPLHKGITNEIYAVRFASEFPSCTYSMIHHIQTIKGAIKWIEMIGYHKRLKGVVKKASVADIKHWNQMYPDHKIAI